tara:strand:+ start:49 stop:1491 length:1443 start_codon:yes stop_codon:yes gene_type:complete
MNKKENQTSKPELQFINSVHQIIIDYLDKKNDRIVNSVKKLDSIKSDVDFSINKPNDYKSIKKLIDQYLESAVNTASPHFYNQLFSGFSTMGYIGEIIATITNSSMYTYEMSPMATLIEKELIKKMSTIIGYNDGFGTFVTGGSNANLIAMLAARDKINPESKKRGLFNNKILCAFVSEEAHYSFIKAGYQLGIGTDQIIRVPCNRSGHMDTNLLLLKIKKSISEGKNPFFVGATAGTTVRGVFDPMNKINKICKKFNLWFHIDGSWGGSVMLSKKHRKLIKGSKNSDSFTWCAHKMMGLPLICSVILMKNKNILEKINNVPGTDYLFHGKDQDGMDLGIYSLQCGRRVDSIKLWLAWKYYGNIGYEKRIDRLFNLAKYAEAIINNSALFKLLSPVESLNICFQIKTKDLNKSECNYLTKETRERLVNKGKIMVNYAMIEEQCCLRLIIVNFDLEQSHLDIFFKSLESISKKIIEEIKST